MLCEILNLNKKDAQRILPALFAYYFGRIKQVKFEAYVGDREEALRIKAASKRSGYILKNCKLYAYAHYYAVTTNEPLPKAKDYGVEPLDAKLLRQLNLKHLNVKKYRAFTLKEFDKLVSRTCADKDMNDYIGKFISKKMLFLIKSYGLKRSDIHTEMLEALVSVSYRQYPIFDDHLHFINVGKANIKSQGHTLINFYTAKKREKLLKNDDGAFESVEVDVDNLTDMAAPDTLGQDSIMDHLQYLAKAQASLNVRPEQRQFLKCLGGQHCDSFSEYLAMPNEVAIECMTYKNYMKKAMKHFDMTAQTTERLFVRLKQEILGATL